MESKQGFFVAQVAHLLARESSQVFANSAKKNSAFM